MIRIPYPIFFLILSNIFCTETGTKMNPEKPISGDELLRIKADSLAKNIIIIDTHIDVPYRLHDKWEDISKNTGGNFDYVKAVKGGLNAPFFAIYVSADYEGTGKSKPQAENLIAMIEKIVKNHPDKFAMAYSAADITKNFREGLISLPLGMENGSPIEGNLENLDYFYRRGIRYITLAHYKNNHICDSSNEPRRKWNGLSAFGEKVIKEMNRLGIMIDVSHISDSSFYDIIKLSRTPVIASHSSCRHFTPGWERNMSDDMIKALAENGGVIQINFGSSFLKDDLRKKMNSLRNMISGLIKEKNLKGKAAQEFRNEYLRQHHPGYASTKDVVKHIDHVVKLAGIDHVGLGSDFDGVGDTLPEGLKDVSGYPNLIYELLKAGYTEKDVEKICSGNILRVWSEVEKSAGNSGK